MSITRRKSREVAVGKVIIGGNSPVSVQTMVKAPPGDLEAIMAQIKASAELGCDLIRLAIPNPAALPVFAQAKQKSPIPLVADIHFNAKLALGAIEAGADKVRINPGNMNNWEELRLVVEAAKEKNIALRIGVNSGSIRSKRTNDAESMPVVLANEVLSYIERIESFGFNNLVISLKASDVADTIAANLAVADKMDYPLHLGVTAAGPEDEAMLKSAIGIGGLLAQGVGDTIRLSFTGSSESEVVAAHKLLRSVGLLRDRVEVVSCPTCGRCKVDMQKMVYRVREKLSHIKIPLRVAVMGCEVNGPGEASEADLGIAAGKGKYALFQAGKLSQTLPEENALEVLCREVEKISKEIVKDI